MTFSDSLVDFIAAAEGFRGVAERDGDSSGEPWTLGYGETDDVKEGDTITPVAARARLVARLGYFARSVSSLVTRTDLTQPQFNALVDFSYNLGVERLAHSSLLGYVNAGCDGLAELEFSKWVHSGGNVLPGLVARRKAEAAWYGAAA